ncbi:AEC family transporter [Faecalicoccus pleomorphus]|uniref:AEC family transporter n=2 Tax=Faecalicoccus pleomorphus TaxID=1323 RepID=UPI00197D3B9C
MQGDKLDVRLYMANSKSVHIFTSLEGYKVSFFRLIIVPLCTAIFMMLLPIQYYDIRMTLLIANSTPVGVMLAMFSQLYTGDFEYGARIVSLSTLLSLVSIPLVLSMTRLLW